MSAEPREVIRWLQRRRWFQGKARTATAARVIDTAALDGGTRWMLLDVDYADAPTERYQLVLLPAGGDDGVRASASEPAGGDHAALDATAGGDVLRLGGGTWVDAAASAHVLRPLALLAADGGTLPTAAGTAIDGATTAPCAVPAAGRMLGAEQSNTSVVFGEDVLLKLFRRLEPGINPEVELTNALTAAGSRHVPPQVGALVYRGDGVGTALGVVSEFLKDVREGWRLAVDDAVAATQAPGGDLGARPFIARLADLGAAVADTHAILAEVLPSAPATDADVTVWADAVRRQAAELLDSPGPPLAIDRAAVAAAVDAAAAAVVAPGLRLRTHGDLHLGQVVDSSRGWQVLDFEGEPARPIDERRALLSPARDLAGMLRSFDYAAATGVWRAGGAIDDALPPVLLAWREAARESFLRGYDNRARQGVDDALLTLFELEKAIYEVEYERANRPDWLAIALGGVRRILDHVGHGDAGPGTATIGAVMSTRTDWHADSDAVAALLEGTHRNPHHILGLHEHADGSVVRVLRPDVADVEVVPDDGDPVAATGGGDGLFEALVPQKLTAGGYRLRMRTSDGTQFETRDPYAFWPTLGDIDLHLAGEGRHQELWRRLGAHVMEVDGVTGTAFAVWAPNARSVRVVGSFNDWDGRRHPMRMLGTGIWELFIPDVAPGAYYRYEVLRADGHLTLHSDPVAFWTEPPPQNAGRVFVSHYQWGDDEWMRARTEQQWHRQPLSVYEVHLGSWRHADGQPLGYHELAHQLADYAIDLGFTHIELLPVAEHPYGGSWGYQVTGHFAPTARFGDPDDFRYLVDHLHQRGIGVIVDWVPAHFPKDEWALARFDGTALYEHADPRQGEHPDWGTLVFNFGRNEVRNFLLASALFWLEELHVDGLRVDAVASMLYLDYSREEGEWVPNAYGGNENLEAIEFLKETAKTIYGRNPGALLIAEESTAWPGVSRPVHLGGLGFGFKWNMGWMHDTLSYFSRDPIHRRFHHNELTFGLLYAWSENYVLPLSHDEVVHGKRSLLDKMPGDRWQKFANLRALFAYMWAHPGKQLLFMGGEIGQWREWDYNTQLDWHLLGEADHRGLQRLVGDLNGTYRASPALWQRDREPEGFQWIDASNADANLLSFVRYADDNTPLVCIVNMSPVPRDDQRFGLPRAGRWRELLNTDAEVYGGGNLGNLGTIVADQHPWHGMTASAQIVTPPLATLWLVPDS
jgi:1,4-alpha-glucan branching enzyme